MDPWQASVEKRLDSLDGRMGRVEADVSSMKVSVGKIETRLDHLPGKGFVVSSAIATVTALSAVLILLQRLGVLH